MVPVTVLSSGYIVPEKRGAALADPGPGSENGTLWEPAVENMLQSSGDKTKERKHKVSLSKDEGQRPSIRSALVHGIITYTLLCCPVYSRDS